MNEKEDRWSELERRALAHPNNVTTVLSATLRELISAARANVNPGGTRLREIAARAKDVRTFEVTISQTVEVDAQIVTCGNCGAIAPDPPASVLGATALEYVKGSTAGKRPLVQSGNFHYGKWSPDGWTAAQHFRGPMICPECTELVVNALAKRRKPAASAAPIVENVATPSLGDAHELEVVGDGTRDSPRRMQCKRCGYTPALGVLPRPCRETA